MAITLVKNADSKWATCSAMIITKACEFRGTAWDASCVVVSMDFTRQSCMYVIFTDDEQSA